MTFLPLRAVILLFGLWFLIFRWNGESASTQPDIAERLALPASQAASSILLVLLAVAALWVIFGVERPEITAMAGTGAPSNPLNKTVQAVGADWWQHFKVHPWMLVAPVLAYLGLLAAIRQALTESAETAFLLSAIGIVGTLPTVGFGLFPFSLISTTDSRPSLTVWDATASHFNLLPSFRITVVFLPIVLLYTRWVYRMIWGSVIEDKVLRDSHTLYRGESFMWYFTWILGVGFAAAFAFINAVWLESVCDIDTHGIDQSCGTLNRQASGKGGGS